ncbi:MAG: sensor histidine kinase [Saprospiraceae bacterium]|nr:sensor histidine kinase [Saprospiraceae bacterium]
MQWINNRFLRHTFFWLAYLLVMGFVGGRYDLKFGRAYAQEALELPLRMALVYAVLARTPILGKGNWWRWLAEMAMLLTLATFAGRLLMYQVIHPLFYKNDYTFTFWNEYRFVLTFLDLALTLFLVLSLRFARQYMDFASQKQQLLLEKTTAELHALRNQTNPHFLFNTLTNIYALARKNAPETPEVVLRLSNILRYILYECNTPTIPIRHELHIVEQYIALEKIRFGNRLVVTSDVNITDPSAVIPPLLLLPLFENAFKHGAGESRFNIELDWELKEQPGALFFRISNSCEPHTNSKSHEEPGIGLNNLRRQLELLFPTNHQLTIEETRDRYTLSLKLHTSTSNHV